MPHFLGHCWVRQCVDSAQQQVSNDCVKTLACCENHKLLNTVNLKQVILAQLAYKCPWKNRGFHRSFLSFRDWMPNLECQKEAASQQPFFFCLKCPVFKNISEYFFVCTLDKTIHCRKEWQGFMHYFISCRSFDCLCESWQRDTAPFLQTQSTTSVDFAFSCLLFVMCDLLPLPSLLLLAWRSVMIKLSIMECLAIFINSNWTGLSHSSPQRLRVAYGNFPSLSLSMCRIGRI